MLLQTMPGKRICSLTGVRSLPKVLGMNDTPLVVNSIVTNLPAQVKTASTFIVTAEVHYAYTPVIGYVMTGTFDLKDQFYLRPRLSDTITRSAT